MNKVNELLKGGKVLEKTYKGRTFKVIQKEGKLYLGNAKKKAHRSLSGVAEAITGHPTSGLGFFGLLKK